MTEDRIVKNVPKTYQAWAKKLIGHLKDYMGVSWNAKDEMVVDGKTLAGSNISVLVKRYNKESQTRSWSSWMKVSRRTT